MAKDINLQDIFLNQARKERIPVTIYITNGFQFKGVVKGFDNYTVILDTDGKQNLIYKHAISTITPLKTVSVFDIFDKDEERTDASSPASSSAPKRSGNA
jgi:host factor-I protein